MKESNTNQAEQLNETAVISCALELFHLANYLSYDIKVKNENRAVKIITLKGYYYTGDTERLMFSSKELIGGICVKEIKPILKPLSDLIDNILDDDNDKNYRLNCELGELLNTNHCDYFVKALIEKTFYSVDIRLWSDVEDFLNKNHFDWKFNLIEKGLAISINDVN